MASPCQTNPPCQRLLPIMFVILVEDLQGLEMCIFHNMHISAFIHSSRFIWKITTRKAYASFKTSVFLRSLNVKESSSEYVVNKYIHRTDVSAKCILAFPRTP